jgi:hypothetical protein
MWRSRLGRAQIESTGDRWATMAAQIAIVLLGEQWTGAAGTAASARRRVVRTRNGGAPHLKLGASRSPVDSISAPTQAPT